MNLYKNQLKLAIQSEIDKGKFGNDKGRISRSDFSAVEYIYEKALINDE